MHWRVKQSAKCGVSLAADYRRESDLGAEGIDPINKGKPAASFYGTQAGVSYLKDRKSVV